MTKLKIEINDEDFLKKPTEEQNLPMFKKLCAIDQNGCSWSRKQKVKKSGKTYAVAGGSGGAVVFIIELLKSLIGK